MAIDLALIQFLALQVFDNFDKGLFYIFYESKQISIKIHKFSILKKRSIGKGIS